MNNLKLTNNVSIVGGDTQIALIFQYDPQGVKQPYSYYTGNSDGDDAFYDVVIDANDNVIAVGSLYSAGLDSQLWIRKWNPALKNGWSETFGG